MSTIDDSGKVWVRNQFSPAFAVRVGDLIVIPGKNENETIDYWLVAGYFCVDLHDMQKKQRIARKFPLTASPSTPGTLFSGFEKTKHADILAMTDKHPDIQEKTLQGEEYESLGGAQMDRDAFWKWSGLE